MNRRVFQWILGAAVVLGVIAIIIARPLPFLFPPDLPLAEFYGRALYIIILAASMCLFRIARGPTGADRIMSIEILGVLVVGLTALLAITTGRSWYLDIGIAWIILSFIGTLTLAKYLSGKKLNE